MDIKIDAPITLITIIFIILKCAGFIAWPWIWVVAPVWISLSLVAVLAIFAAFFAR